MNLLFASALLLIGFLLIVAEVFFPSLGALGVLAVLSLGGGVFFAFHESMGWGIAFLTGAVAGGFVTLFVAFKFFPSTPMGKRLISSGPTFGDDPSAADPKLRDLLGKHGTAITYLRPAGFVEIESRRIDCVAEGELLDAGTLVTVFRIDGNRVVVKRKA